MSFKQLHVVTAGSILTVATVTDLPTVGSSVEGDVRWVADTDKFYIFTGSAWVLNGTGNITGPGTPASTTDNTLVRWDGTGGDTIQASDIVVDDSENVSGIANLAISGTVSLDSTVFIDNKGTDNTWIGYTGNAVAAPGGTRNVAIGRLAGNALDGGGSNIFIGYSAGLQTAGGAGNVGIGYEVLKSVGNYAGVVAIGTEAGNVNTANDGVFVGRAAGVNNSTGHGNVFLGRTSGSSTTTGSYNIGVGYQSIQTHQSGSGNIVLGADTSTSAAVSASVVIGREATAASSNIFVAGSSNYPLSNIYFGKGVTNATPTEYTISGTGGSGTDIAGAALSIAAGAGTGSGLGGSIQFKTAAAGASGASLNSQTTRVSIDSTGVVNVSGLTASRALVTDSSKNLTSSAVTDTELGYVSGVTSAIQTQLGNKQGLDATLTALAAYNTNGLLTQTAADTFTGRTLTAGSSKISITNGSGVSGNPTVDLGTVTTADISEGANLYFTDERAQDAVGGILTDSSTVDFTYNDGAGTITAVVLEAGLTHDNIGGTLGLAKGGSNKALTAVNGGLVYSDANSFEITSAGTASQWVLSGGAGTPTMQDITTRAKTITDATSPQLTIATNSTDATSKSGYISMLHYTSSTEEPLCLIGGDTSNTTNDVSIGGGFGSANTAENVRLYSAADHTTTTGSIGFLLDNAGSCELGRTTASDASHVMRNNSTTATRVVTITNNDSTTSSDARYGLAVRKGSTTDTTGTNRFVLFEINGGGTGSGYIGSNGANAAAFFSTSDERLKQNIVPLADGLAAIDALRPVAFEWKTEPGKKVKGFIAQEVKDIIPEAVYDPKGEGEYAFCRENLIPYMVAAIQELSKELKALKDK